MLNAICRPTISKLFTGTKFGQKIMNRVLTKKFGTMVEIYENGSRKFEKIKGNTRTWTYINNQNRPYLTNRLTKDSSTCSTREIIRHDTDTHIVRERVDNYVHTVRWNNAPLGNCNSVPRNFKESKLWANYNRDGKYTYEVSGNRERTVKKISDRSPGQPLPSDGLVHPSSEAEAFFA